uniref:Acireductone synthase n=1 Tax=Chaetoceros debilis TaxID=122233 RepID=A0A7S3PXQ8_9STRA|mmetsp:Transcript_23335/g.35486  ORF Transcript_23335/g.35486 Transcript_23335/m.35486 type:complete len:326 (+) Transcript_23335:44-1021(+)
MKSTGNFLHTYYFALYCQTIYFAQAISLHRTTFLIHTNMSEPATKRQKLDNATNGFNAVTDIDNASDLTENKVPILPRDAKILLLDIEGCTTSISFVHDVLFPFALNNVEKYLEDVDNEGATAIVTSLVEDVAKLDESHATVKAIGEIKEFTNDKHKIQEYVKALMNNDVKATGLKGLQGKIWKSGYASGELKGHIYDDFKPLLDWCKDQGISVNIYSSGSIGAQKLLFGHSEKGDLCPCFEKHFDTTSGGKKESASYKKIAESIGVDPKEICFISDAEGELVAARDAGIGFPVMSVRPGNAPLTEIGREFPIIYSLLQVCGSGK